MSLRRVFAILSILPSAPGAFASTTTPTVRIDAPADRFFVEALFD